MILAVHLDNQVHELARLDGRYVSTGVAGGMTGRLFGCYATTGSLLIRPLTYVGSDVPLTNVSVSSYLGIS